MIHFDPFNPGLTRRKCHNCDDGRLHVEQMGATAKVYCDGCDFSQFFDRNGPIQRRVRPRDDFDSPIKRERDMTQTKTKAVPCAECGRELKMLNPGEICGWCKRKAPAPTPGSNGQAKPPENRMKGAIEAVNDHDSIGEQIDQLVCRYDEEIQALKKERNQAILDLLERRGVIA